VCGALLAVGAFAAATRLPARESARRRARGASPLFPARFARSRLPDTDALATPET